MTKAELEKEAYLYAKNSKDVQNFECGFDIAFKSYLASAKPREKQITGLSKHILELQKDKGNLIDRCRELEQQNNWLEGCKSELGEHLGKANDRIVVLEKRCANYEMTISKMEKGTCDICKETEKDNRIAELKDYNKKLLQSDIDKQNKIVLLSKKVNDLQKENVRLKDYRLTTLEKQQTDMSKYALNLEHKLSWYDNKLNKAKVIINKWLRVYNTNTTKEVIKESEDFLKEE